MTTNNTHLRLSILIAVLLTLLLTATVAARPRTLTSTPANTPPTADFSIDPPQGVVGTIFFFDAMISSDNEDSDAWLEASFDYDGDGIWDDIGLNPTNPPTRYTYSAPGDYQVKLVIKDTGGLTNTKIKTVHVGDVGNNTPPSAHCNATPTQGPPGTTFTFSAANSSDTQDPTSALKAKWDKWGIFDFRGQSWQPVTQPVTFTYNSLGIHEVDLIVMDSGYLMDSTSCQVEVVPPGGNTPPTARLVITPTSGTITTTFTFDGSGSFDSEDDLSRMEISFDWSNDGRVDLRDNASSGPWTNVYDDMWGDITVRMTIKDSGGLTDEITRTLHITTPYYLYLPSFRKGGTP
ncbi:MAG: hypothetical protein GXP38_09730 [Chloroflexi bacterium]|nr:hypothetical protein [Chloroflexota bacterium]